MSEFLWPGHGSSLDTMSYTIVGVCGSGTSTWEVDQQPRRKNPPFRHEWLWSGFGSASTVEMSFMNWPAEVALGLCLRSIGGPWWTHSIPSIQSLLCHLVAKWNWIIKLAFGWSSSMCSFYHLIICYLLFFWISVLSDCSGETMRQFSQTLFECCI